MSHPERFPVPNGVLWRHADDLTHLLVHLIAGETPTADELVQLARCTGNLNNARKPYENGNPPPPDPSDPYADLRWRRANVGSLAAFSPAFFVEATPLKLAYPALADDISRIAAYYGPGGFGNVTVSRTGNSFEYVDIKSQKWLPDINGAADAMILANSVSAAFPNGVPAPSINIP